MLVTGHTGFKGSWLCLWLEMLGAEVSGLSLQPERGALYSRAGLQGRWSEHYGDVRDLETVQRAYSLHSPDVVFHLAAQPLVQAGYDDPIQTFQTNVLGTMNVLEAARSQPSVRGCVIITTDKVYRPRKDGHRHREDDPLGGEDPYSASKAAAEHVAVAWRQILASSGGPIVVTARAGNVIGGGDVSKGRLLPDLVKAFTAHQNAVIRNPLFTRPWQHVLDPLSGYLRLAELILRGESVPQSVNFGPAREYPVAHIADLATLSWGHEASWRESSRPGLVEAPFLALDSTLALDEISWHPIWDADEAVRRTVRWWKDLAAGSSAVSLCTTDIMDFSKRLIPTGTPVTRDESE